MKKIEGRNTGVPTILRAMKVNGSDPPVFETNEDRNYFTVIFPVQERFLVSSIPKPKVMSCMDKGPEQ